MADDSSSNSGGILGALGPIAPIIGAGISGIANLVGGGNQQAASAQSVQQQEAYATQMSDTQYQRTVASLQGAGLNPMLAVNGSPPVSSPQGSTYQPPNVLGSAANSASTAGTMIASTQASIDQMNHQNDLIDAQKDKTDQDRLTSKQQQGLLGAQTAQTMANTNMNTVNATNSESNVDIMGNDYMTDNPGLIHIQKILGTGLGTSATEAGGLGLGAAGLYQKANSGKNISNMPIPLFAPKNPSGIITTSGR